MNAPHASSMPDPHRSMPMPAGMGGSTALMERHPLSNEFYQYAPHPEPDDSLTLKELWHIILLRKWTIATFLLIAVVTTVIGTYLMTPIYRASSTLQIERDSLKVVQFQNVEPTESAADRDFYQTQYELLQSRSLAERVIDKLGLLSSPQLSKKESQSVSDWVEQSFTGEKASQAAKAIAVKPEEAKSRAITRFLQFLRIEPIRNSRLVRVQFESPDPQLATRVVNSVTQSFIDINLERRMDSSSYAKDFLTERLTQVRAKLEDSERSLIEFARKAELLNIDDKKSVASQNMEDMNSALAKAELERIKFESIYAQLNSESAGVSQILESKVIQELKQFKSKLENEYQEQSQIYKPGFPKMVQLKSQIDDVDKKLEGEIRLIRSAAKAEFDAAKQRESALRGRLAAAKTEVLSTQGRSIQYNILKRDVDTNRNLYDGLLQRLKEVGVAGGVGINNISIVDKATTPLRPTKPNLGLNVAIAVLVGLIGGVLLALLFEHFDDTFKSPEEIERLLGTPIIGVIPLPSKSDTLTKEQLALASHTDPRSVFSEAYRSLRTALQFSTATGAPKVLHVTSSIAGEGKSTTSLNLAINFAQTGQSVLLIDGDLRNPSLHKHFGLDNSIGLSNHLVGNMEPENVTRLTTVPNLYFMPSGHLPPNPAELLSSQRMISLLDMAKQHFTHIIIDSAPVLGLADALVLANICDGTVMVVEANATRKGSAKNSAKRLRSVRAHLIGSLVTKYESIGDAYSYYNYYAYSGGDTKRLGAA
jgi:polysaccharide biosynthesis transport protein